MNARASTRRLRGLAVATDGYQDALELAHPTISAAGSPIAGAGTIPCPAAITVLLLCLQLKELTLGFTLVLCFSIGLAITLVAVGAAAALSVRSATKRWTWFSTIGPCAPYVSGLLIIAVGFYVTWHG